MTAVDLTSARENMVEQQLRTWEVLNEHILETLDKLGRERFTPKAFRNMAYADMQIPIGHGQVMLEPKVEGRLLQALDPRPDDRVLEIGTGWGGFAIHAAKTRGCHVTTTTISEAQYAHTARRIQEEGLEQQITLLKEDYRALSGTYDRVISVEMIEAVGHHYLDTYLAKIERLLAADGQAMLQAITIRDQRFEAAKREMDFIKRYIFPGGFLPSHHAILKSLTRKTSLNMVALDEIGQHYARTLREWRHRFEASLEAVRAQGYDERFIRMWRYYLCYCEGGFIERSIGTCHLVLAKPQAKPAPLTGAP